MYDVNDTRYGNEIPMEERRANLLEAEQMILEEADKLGLLDESYDEEYESGDFLNESTYSARGTVMKLDKKARMNWFKSRSAIAYAKANNDPMYKKLVKFSRGRKKMIAAINKKYASKSIKRSKELIKKSKATSNLFAKATKHTASKKTK